MKTALLSLLLLLALIAAVLFLHDNDEVRLKTADEAATSTDLPTLSSDAHEPVSVISAKNQQTSKSAPSPGRPSSEPSLAEESVYDVVFGGLGGPLQNVYAAYKDEPRDDAWAGAMESGIKLSMEKSQIAWATVEHVECHNTICVVFGYMHDSADSRERDPYSVLGQSFGDGWWQGPVDMALRQHSYDGEDIRRFAVLITSPARMLQLTMP